MTKQYSFADACSIADYYERTGLYPKGMTEQEFKSLMTKHNITSYTGDDIDPAGGHGLNSHI